MLVKYAVPLPLHSSFRILSHQISPGSTSNGSNINSQQGISNLTLKRFRVTLPIANNDNNAISVCTVVNALMEVIHGIDVDANKFKIPLWRSKQPNLEVLKYIKDGKYPDA